MREFEQQYQEGITTDKEKYNHVVDAWSKCTDQVGIEMMREISQPNIDPKTGRTLEVNSIFMMANSGARGSQQQMKQLAGMRGLMAKPSGEIIETPILSNFKEGLTVLEYFNSTHGARKGLADTALKTANSGYLTRRLVDVANDCIITSEDCGTKKGITVQAVIDGGQVMASLAERILGRTAAEDVKHPETGDTIVRRGKEITEDIAERIELVACAEGPRAVRAVLRAARRRLRQMLRARPRARYVGQYRRGRGRDRRAIDRRAGHPAHHAHVPHRRRGAGCRAIEDRSQPRRQGEDRQPQRGAQLARPAGGDGPQHAGRHRRSQGYRAFARTASPMVRV